MKKTILLTGATGFLGSHLAERFVHEGYKVIILKRSFSDIWRIQHIINKLICYDIDKISLVKPFEEYEIDVVIHTATKYGRKGESVREIVEANLYFPLQLLEISISFNTGTFLNTDTILCKYLNYYSLSKKQFVEWLKIFSEKIRVINLKLEHIYGEKDDTTKFIPWIINQLLKNVEEIKLTEGKQKRDFVYVQDVVEAYYMVLIHIDNLEKRFYEYEIGSGNSMQIRTLVELIKKLTGNNKTFLHFGALPYRENEIMESRANLEMIKRDIGWFPKVSLEEGLLRTIRWYKNREKVNERT
ncbi:NAD-dependent epimerase/dehydratase family protein [Thermodesulfatator atlanticus]|uniref:NAD-dependent epimerase/dehydratase family protein n=1 Tax=Thermodesulfatator atlanticus TaxID=501497 RepID=UPI0003B35F96